MRLKPLDKVVFEQEGIGFGVHHDIFHVVYVRDHGAYLAFLFLVEIRIDAPFEVLGLAHVDNRALLVEILVHARLLGKNG